MNIMCGIDFDGATQRVARIQPRAEHRDALGCGSITSLRPERARPVVGRSMRVAYLGRHIHRTDVSSAPSGWMVLSGCFPRASRNALSPGLYSHGLSGRLVTMRFAMP